MLSCYFQEKQRSFTSGDFWVLPRWQVTHFQFLSVFQDGGHIKFPTLGQRLNVKIPTQGKVRSVNFPWVAPPPPPPTLGLNIDRCIMSLLLRIERQRKGFLNSIENSHITLQFRIHFPRKPYPITMHIFISLSSRNSLSTDRY